MTVLEGKTVGFYASDSHAPGVIAAVAGLRRIGARVLMRNARYIGDGGPSEFAGEEVCVVNGLNRYGAKIVAAYQKHRPGVPILNVERPFLARRGNDWLRIAPAVGYWMPRTARPGVELALVPVVPPIPEDGAVLLIGFSPDFPGMPSEADAIAMVREWIASARAAFGANVPIWYRPHPAKVWIPPDLKGVEIDRRVSDGPCAALASIVESRCVVAHHSAAGMWAGLLGRPVICSPDAFFAACGTTWHEMQPKREEALNVALRCASAEWPLDRVASGEAFEWLAHQMSGAADFDDDADLVDIIEMQRKIREGEPPAETSPDGYELQQAEEEAALEEMRQRADAEHAAKAAQLKAEDEARIKAERVYADGAKAKADGLSISSCPHRPRSADSVTWRKGYKGEAL